MPARIKPEARVIVRYAPDLARQVRALLRLLGHTDLGPEIPLPQDNGGAGANNEAAVASSRHLWSDYREYSTADLDNQ